MIPESAVNVAEFPSMIKSSFSSKNGGNDDSINSVSAPIPSSANKASESNETSPNDNDAVDGNPDAMMTSLTVPDNGTLTAIAGPDNGRTNITMSAPPPLPINEREAPKKNVCDIKTINK